MNCKNLIGQFEKKFKISFQIDQSHSGSFIFWPIRLLRTILVSDSMSFIRTTHGVLGIEFEHSFVCVLQLATCTCYVVNFYYLIISEDGVNFLVSPIIVLYFFPTRLLVGDEKGWAYGLGVVNFVMVVHNSLFLSLVPLWRKCPISQSYQNTVEIGAFSPHIW